MFLFFFLVVNKFIYSSPCLNIVSNCCTFDRSIIANCEAKKCSVFIFLHVHFYIYTLKHILNAMLNTNYLYYILFRSLDTKFDITFFYCYNKDCLARCLLSFKYVLRCFHHVSSYINFVFLYKIRHQICGYFFNFFFMSFGLSRNAGWLKNWFQNRGL